jgi:hypothetical protein
MGIIKNYHDKKWTIQLLDALYNSIDIDIEQVAFPLCSFWQLVSLSLNAFLKVVLPNYYADMKKLKIFEKFDDILEPKSYTNKPDLKISTILIANTFLMNDNRLYVQLIMVISLKI